MFEKRLSLIEVDQLMEDGKSMSAVARELGFSKQAVSAALKKRREKSGELQVIKSSPKAVSDFEGLRRLKKLMDPVFHEIKFLNSEIDKLIGEEVKGDDRKNLNFQRLKYVAEGRKQLALALLIDEKRFSFEETLKFQNFILEEIGKIDETTRDQILEGIRRGKSIRNLLNQS